MSKNVGEKTMVTMPVAEYIDLLKKADKYDTVEQAILDGIEITQYERYNSGYGVALRNTLGTALQMVQMQHITSYLMENPHLMAMLKTEEEHYIDLKGSNFSSYNFDSDPWILDMLDRVDFKKMWEELDFDLEAYKESLKKEEEVDE